MCNILLVDVGGTNIDLYLYDKKTYKIYHLENMPSNNLEGDNCYQLIKSKFNLKDYSKIIIGIPGEVKKVFGRIEKLNMISKQAPIKCLL